MSGDMRADALIEAQALLGQAVQVGSREAVVAVSTQPVPPQAVNHDPDNVHPFLRKVDPAQVRQ
jgi:hypothetical protein